MAVDAWGGSWGGAWALTWTRTTAQQQAERPAGGFFFDFESHMRRRDAAKRKRREDEEEAKRIADATAREIAAFLHAQEAKDAERAEIERLRTLVIRHAASVEQEAFTERVRHAFSRALAQQNASALLALDRELRRQMEEEEFAVLLALLNDD